MMDSLFDLRIISVNEDKFHLNDELHDIAEISRQIQLFKPKRLQIIGFRQFEFDYLIDLIKETMKSLEIFHCEKITNFKQLEELNNLKYLLEY